MAKKKNRGKKASGAKPNNAAVPENTPTSAQGKKAEAVDTPVCVEENIPVGCVDKADESVSLPSVTTEPEPVVCKKQYGKDAADVKDQGAFLSEFESKALQVATQTAQSSEPEVVEKVVEVVKEVEVMVEDPALKSQVEELSKQNAELRTQVEDLQKTPAPAADDSKRVGELEEEVRAVTDKVAHYQRVLADTENLLKSLQASVESEEVAWNKRLSEKDSDVRQLTADKANLQLQVKQLEDTLEKVKQAEDAAAELCGMEFALTCIEKSLPFVVTQMQAQLKVLQDQLQKEEKEKASLLEQLHAAQEQLTKTATQYHVQGGGGSDEASLVDLKTDNDKLRTLVSVGQDASRQQEELIEQLQKELAAVKAALAASRVSKMGYMVGWVGRNSNNTTTTTINNINSLEQQVTVQLLFQFPCCPKAPWVICHSGSPSLYRTLPPLPWCCVVCECKAGFVLLNQCI
ncbi:putative intracellular protein transport protein USO1-like [Homarus americanus]|uniref:Putative intracellular protein transport protein USO1-like n=1 Tax=Homarus americanus TaxID=6706 RepID=A0A8J5JFD2_HOMAM|nr:putative intracellular protein transport protein USO1-like [Homarus americanus]